MEHTIATLTETLHANAKRKLEEEMQQYFDGLWNLKLSHLRPEILDKELKIGTSRGTITCTLRQLNFVHREAIVMALTPVVQNQAVHDFVKRFNAVSAMVENMPQELPQE